MSQTTVGVRAHICANRWHGSTARELVFRRADGQPWNFIPGQHIALHLVIKQQNYLRYYSVLHSSQDQHHLHILVKNGAPGGAASFLCEQVAVGAELVISGPQGQFTPARYDAPMTFLAAGSGVVPLFSMFNEAVQRGTAPRTFILADQNQHSALLWPQVQSVAALKAQHTTVHSWWVHERGLPTVAGLLALLAPGAAGDLYFCGPAAFCDLATQAAQVAGYPASQVYTEGLGR